MTTPVTVKDCIAYGAKQFDQADLFFGHGTDNAQDEAFWLVFYALGIDFHADESVYEQPVSAEQWQQIDELFTRRIKERVPAAYLTGEGWFCGYPFLVNEHVLVPRSPIGELIQQCFEPWLSPEKTDSLRILDLCTGCGCIGLASALFLPEAKVDISDISPEALAVARQNMSRLGLESRVEAIESDLFQSMGSRQYDLIVSNPPYVDAGDLASMPAEYQAEPAIALGSGADGLDITRRLLREAADYLSDDGLLIVEVGNSWVNLEAAFPRVPFLWLEFASGGHGVFLMRRDELVQYRAEFL